MGDMAIDTLRALATAQGLELSDEELGRLLPLVQAGQALMQSLRDAPLGDLEPSCQYRIL
jgi:hypothetical protein